MPERLREVSLSNLPSRSVTSITKDRWGTPTDPGPLPQMIMATQRLMAADGMSGDSTMVIVDGTENHGMRQSRENLLRRLDETETPIPISFITPHQQERLVGILTQRTHLSEKTVRKIVADSGYDARIQVDALYGAMSLVHGKELKMLGLDDDTKPPAQIKTVKPELLATFGAHPEPNSYIFWVEKPLPEDAFNYGENSLRGFFDPLGKSVGQLAEIHPNLVVSGAWNDEMHEVMENLRARPDVFHVTHQGNRIRNVREESQVNILSVTNTKTWLPDPRTKTYVEQLILNDLVPPEGTIFSYKAGPAHPFVFYKAGYAGAVTNVDSANLSWLFNSRTAYLLRWYPSDPNISRGRGLVDGQYRSENEWLTMYLVLLSKKLQQRYAYFTGIETEIEHYRAKSGVRPKDPAEQAASSLFGHEASEVALNRLEFEADGRAHLNLDGIEGHVVPRDNARAVFRDMKILEGSSAMKIVALEEERSRSKDGARRRAITRQIEQYREIMHSFDRRIAGGDFHEFYRRLDDEVRDQAISTDQYLRAYPVVIDELTRIIREGDFKVLQYDPPSERNKSVPKLAPHGDLFTGSPSA